MNGFRLKAAVFSLILTFFILNSCNDQDDIVPYVPVNFTVDLDIANDMKISGNSFIYEFEGFAGVIVYCEFFDPVTPSNSIYYAFDTACTVELSEECSVENEGSSVTVVCPCCSSEYNLLGGFPVNGEASIGLKQYNVTVLADMLHVYN